MGLRDERDNDPVILFQFDDHYPTTAAHSQLSPSRLPSLPLSPSTVLMTQLSRRHFEQSGDEVLLVDDPASMHHIKGKAVSQPLLIGRARNSHHPQDFFPQSLSSSFSSGTSLRLDHGIPPLSPSSLTSSADVLSVQTPDFALEERQPNIASFDNPVHYPDGVPFADSPSLGKGKARASPPPTLPPLVFSPVMSPDSEDWPPFMQSAAPGPASCTSSFAGNFDSPTQMTSPGQTSSGGMPDMPSSEEGFSPVIPNIPSRRHSFSNLALQSTPLVDAQSSSKAKVNLPSGSSSNIARKLLFRKRTSTPEIPSSASVAPPDVVVDTDLPGSPSVGQGSCFLPVCMDLKSMMYDGSTNASPQIDISHMASLYSPSVYSAGRPADTYALRNKGRSYSSPLPRVSSPFDIISLPEPELYYPVRVVSRPLFDELLPRELKLQIFSMVVSACEADFHRLDAGGKWTVLKASSIKNKWVGRDKGIRELVKFGRVSKAWRSLVFDGQLWRELDLSAFPKVSAATVSTITGIAGPFISAVNFTGHSRLLPDTLLDISEDLCLYLTPEDRFPRTQLTILNLQACSALSTHALHHLLTRSPLLENLCVKGLQAVTNTTCQVLAVACRRLLSLNMSRCLNLDGDGIQYMTSEALARGDVLALRELRLSGLKNVTDTVLSALGKAAPHLEVLDLSYISSLHNSAIDAFVACSADNDPGFETVLLSAREAGRDSGDSSKYRRRVTRLRHLSLSSCILLTDIAASHLAHTVPRLEYLEMGAIGSELKDDGLVRLFNTTPYIRKVDLEDACDITNLVIQALTPEATSDGAPQPGHALEHLIVSYAMNISNDAFTTLINKCTRLKVLEADSTRLCGSVVKEFVKSSRQREMKDAKIVAVDCRNVGDNVTKDLSSQTRPRLGWRSHDAKKLGYLDGRDKEKLDVGQDECDEKRVVLKTFYSWQVVDLVKSAREKKQKTKKSARRTRPSEDDLDVSYDRRWWSTEGRRVPAGANTPTLLDLNSTREGCVIM